MTDDFMLFADPSDGGSAIDPDVSLIVAYLARELSPTQIAAVQRRLATDAPFAHAVQPILDAWTVPIPDIARVMEANGAREISPEEVEQGWSRHMRAIGSRRRMALKQGTWSALRIAATIIVIALPVIGIAQVVARFTQRNAPRGGGTAPAGADARGLAMAPGATRFDSLGEGARGVVLSQSTPAMGGETGGALEQPSFPTLSVVEELRLTIAPYNIVSARVSPNGLIALIEGGAGASGKEQLIQVFSPRGDRLATIGAGKPDGLIVPHLFGPGMGWVGDSLWVLSQWGVSVLRISPQVSVVRSMPLPQRIPVPPGAASVPLGLRSGLRAVYPDGGFLITQSFPMEELRRGLGPAADEFLSPTLFVRMSGDGRYIGFSSSDALRSSLGRCQPRSPSGFTGSIPFCSIGGESLPSPDGRWMVFAVGSVADSSNITLHVAKVAIGGDTVFSRQYRVPGVPVNATMVDSGRGVAARWLGPLDPPEQAFMDSVLRTGMPQNVQPVRWILVGSDGTVCVEIHSRTPHQWLVLNAQGDPVGMATIPPNVSLSQVTRGMAWGMTPDNTIIRFRIGP